MRESNAIFCGADSSRVQQQPWFIIIPSKKPIKKVGRIRFKCTRTRNTVSIAFVEAIHKNDKLSPTTKWEYAGTPSCGGRALNYNESWMNRIQIMVLSMRRYKTTIHFQPRENDWQRHLAAGGVNVQLLNGWLICPLKCFRPNLLNFDQNVQNWINFDQKVSQKNGCLAKEKWTLAGDCYSERLVGSNALQLMRKVDY